MTAPAALPGAEPLALAGIGFIALFALWKAQVAPRVARWRAGGGLALHAEPPNV